MRRIAFACLILALSGCGYNTWSNIPFATGSNPNIPPGNSENMRRVRGEEVEVKQLTPEPGDVWPGPLPPEPTLQDLESQSGIQPQPEQPVPGSPLSENPATRPQQLPNVPPPPANRGSSTPPSSNLPGVPPTTAPPASSATPQATVPPSVRNPSGQVVQTPGGPAVTNGGTSSYQTITTPGGGSAIVVPNGNGTSTIIYPNGKIDTVPTPR